MWRLRSTSVAVLAAILATACGGGGGGSSSVAPPPPAAPTRVQISMANQDTVARAAIASILPFTNLSAVSVTPSPAASMAGKASSSSARERGNPMHLTLQAIDFGTARPAAPAGIAHPLAAYSSSENCQLGGSVTVTLDDRDNSATLTAGDTLTMSFVQCSDWANQSINGGITFAFSSVAVTPSTMDVTGSMTLQQFVQVDGAASLSMNGGLAFTLRETAEANGFRDYGTYTVTSSGLTVGSAGGALGYTDTLSYREGYAVTVDEFVPNVPGIAETSTVTATGNFASSVLGNELALTTPQSFHLVAPDEFPREGQLMVYGNANTKLGLTVSSNIQVRMEVCDDGDGIWEGTKMVDWSWLM